MFGAVCSKPFPTTSMPCTLHLILSAGKVDAHMHYDGANGEGLHGYSDSSLEDQTDDCCSTSGYLYLLADGAISWSLHKQKTVAQNTIEAKYMAMTDVGNQAAWYQGFLKELGYSVDDPIPIHGDILFYFILFLKYSL